MVTVIEREAVLTSSEWGESEALIWADLVDSAQNKVAAANFDRAWFLSCVSRAAFRVV